MEKVHQTIKWLEIYNSTGQNIDLSNYALARVSNAQQQLEFMSTG